MQLINALKKYGVVLCVTAICAFSFFSFGFPQTTTARAEDEIDSVYTRIDAYLSDAQEKAHFPAMSVTIVGREELLFSKTYGDCEGTDVPFLLGSVSKSFTALCIMQLAERGKINLDSPIAEYLPEATDGEKITVRQLLNHTGGLGEHQTLENYKVVGRQGVHTYANVNYSLLGKIVESVSGQSYEEYVTDNVFNPLNMSHSAAETNDGLIDGHRNWFGFQVNTAPKYPKSDGAWITVPAGYLCASTDDLGKYLQMYLNGGQGIISKDSIEKMFYENVSVDASIPYRYGMGWTLINEPLKEPALRHSGLVETGMSTVYLLPEREIGIAIAVNTNDYFVGKDLFDRIDWSVALMLMGDEPNQIGENEYITRHLMYDLAYLVVLAVAVLPLCLLPLYKKRLKKGSSALKIAEIALLHLLLPLFLLLIPQIFFSTPLWVVCAFVPDMFTVIAASSALLFLGGMIKPVLFIIAYKKRGKE